MDLGSLLPPGRAAAAGADDLYAYQAIVAELQVGRSSCPTVATELRRADTRSPEMGWPESAWRDDRHSPLQARGKVNFGSAEQHAVGILKQPAPAAIVVDPRERRSIGRHQ